MSNDELRAHIEDRTRTPGGTIARQEREDHAGRKGEFHEDVQPMALAFIRAVHGEPCDCTHCECGR